MHDFIENILSNKPLWPDCNAPGSPIVINSRVNFVRDIEGYKFPAAEDIAECEEIVGLLDRVINDTGAMGRDFFAVQPDTCSETEKKILLERCLVGRNLLTRQTPKQFYAAENGSLSVSVNGSDHLQIQVMYPGLQLHKCFTRINETDDILCSKLDVLYDEKLGFITASPYSIGTGMRASVLLHLPATGIDGNIAQLNRALNALGLVLRDMFGDEIDGAALSAGNIYQVSNRSTLGVSEKDIIDLLGNAVDKIIENEENMRIKLFEHHRSEVLDAIGRSFGLLRYGHRITYREAIDALSLVRLGIEFNVIGSLQNSDIDELFVNIASGQLQYQSGRTLDNEEENIFRAQVIRGKVKELL